MSSFVWPPEGSGGGSGVSSLNALTGAVTLVAGTGITIVPSGQNITINSTASGGGITSINADTTAAQTLTVGTAGTDFAIVDAGSGSHVFNLPTASASNRGALSSADWSTFNGKQAALTIGNLTDAGTDGITVGNGTGAVIGTGTTISQHVADTTHNGYLSSADWNTFNGKGAGTVTGVSVVSANGLAGTVATSTTTPAITLSTTVTGVVKGNGTALSAASAGTDYSLGTSANTTGLVKSTTGTGALTTALAGTDYQAPITLTTTGTSGAATFLSNTLNVPNYAGFANPMTTAGDLIVGGTAGAATRTGIGTSGQILTVSSGVPAWVTPGSGVAPTVQKFLTGSGTYTTPTSPAPLYISVEMVGGGAGGQGGVSGGTSAVAGGNTTFGTSLLTATGGGIGSIGSSGGSGGGATVSSPAIQIKSISGGSGGAGAEISSVYAPGGTGGNSAFGGAGGTVESGSGLSASANSGSGGGGGGFAASGTANTGPGGGAGGYLIAFISSPSATYSYSVGTGGAAGNPGSGGYSGGNGGSGVIIVTEYYASGSTGGSGTVTSVGLTTPSYLTVTGSPVTSSGTLAITGTSQSANLVLASPNGSSGALSPRALVGADVPSLATASVGITIDGAGSVITTGSKGFIHVEYACTIVGNTILADQSGSCVLAISAGTYGAFPTNSSIVASAPPTLTSAQSSQDNTLTGWTTSIAAGTVLQFSVTSATTVTRINFNLKVVRS